MQATNSVISSKTHQGHNLQLLIDSFLLFYRIHAAISSKATYVQKADQVVERMKRRIRVICHRHRHSHHATRSRVATPFLRFGWRRRLWYRISGSADEGRSSISGCLSGDMTTLQPKNLGVPADKMRLHSCMHIHVR